MLYRLLFRLVFSKLDPEWIHHVVSAGLRFSGLIGLTKLVSLGNSRVKSVTAFGLQFRGPFGLAAGFDKNAELVRPLGQLGFSHIEIGTVTAVPQPGNPRPRLFRLVADRALINRMGFNNDGAEVVANRLGRLRARYGADLPIIGVNIGKSRVTPALDAAEDYRRSARLLAPFADYLVVNVSSPNTPGLRDLQAVQALEPIILAVIEESLGLPVLVKIAPDLADTDIVEIAALANRLGIAGIIATNTTISRDGLTTPESIVNQIGSGGLSGAPLKKRSVEVLRLLRECAGGLAIVSVGGVETRSDVEERMSAGATLVQGYTGFVFQGPFWARNLNQSRL